MVICRCISLFCLSSDRSSLIRRKGAGDGTVEFVLVVGQPGDQALVYVTDCFVTADEYLRTLLHAMVLAARHIAQT